MQRLLSLCFFLGFLATEILAERDSTFLKDSLLAIEYFTISDDSYRDVEKCFRYAQLATPLLMKTEQWEKYVYILLGNSYCLERLEEYDDLLENNELAVAEAERLLGTEHAYYPVAVNNLGYVYSVIQEDYTKAMNLYKSALNTLPETSTYKTLVAKGGIYENMGFVAQKEGDYKTALSFFNQSYQQFTKAIVERGKDTTTHYRLAAVHNNIARVYYQMGRQKVAVTSLLKAIEKIKNDPVKNKNNLIKYYLFLAENYLELGRLKETNFYLGKINLFAKLNDSQLAQKKELEGRLLEQSEKFPEAIIKIEEAIQILPEAKIVERSELYFLLGNLYARQNDFPQALENYQKGIRYLMLDEVEASNFENPLPTDNFRSKSAVAKILLAKAQMFQRWFISNPKTEYLQRSSETYLLLSQLTDQLRQQYRSEEAKLFLNSKAANFYEEAIRLAKMLYDSTAQEVYLGQVFYFMEKSKSSILLNELKRKEKNQRSLIPADFLKEIERKEILINYYQKIADAEKGKSDGDVRKIKNINNTIFKLKENKEFYLDSLRSVYPKYFALTDDKVVSLKKIKNWAAKENKTFIEYFMGAQQIYALKIAPQEIRLIALAKEEALVLNARQLLDNLKMESTASLNNFKQSAYTLYENLLAPLQIADDTDIIIIPDGVLGYLPFDVLLKRKTTNVLPRELPFLMRSHPLSYAYSATILQQQNKASNLPVKPFGVFPVFANTNRYLPNSKQESIILKEINGALLQDEKATKANFLQRVKDFDLIHLSTHAVAEDSTLKQPAFYLIDSLFYLSDLYTLDLPAQLVVMSACETGLGRQRNGEGMMSLGRGFTFAGVPSVVTSLWKVNDRASADIMATFYKELQKGKPKDQALRQAKLDYLDNCLDTKSAPYFWAGFIPMGNTTALKFSTPPPYYLFWLLLPLFFIGYFIRNRKGK